MSRILQAIRQHARVQPQSTALLSDNSSLSYASLVEYIDKLAAFFQQQGLRCLALMIDNHPDWIIIDLACQQAGITLVPIPVFFSSQQVMHSLTDAGCDYVITDQATRFEHLHPEQQAGVQLNAMLAGQQALSMYSTGYHSRPSLMEDTAKITYTSGTTGTPKGVCLSQASMDRVCLSLLESTDMQPVDRHLSVLPYATLLENLAGVYLPLLAGACCIVLPLQQVGIGGAAQLDIKKLHRALDSYQASTSIFIPQILQSLLEYVAAGASTLPRLRFVAVGGAPVAPRLLSQAEALGIAVYQGYGLSECASVVCVNSPRANKPGSVGKPLPHVTLSFAADDEILIKGALMQGYLGEPTQLSEDGFYASGDTGYLDDEGYLFLTGRKKNMFITSFGRNVAPEWVEQELVLQSPIQQAVVFGEGLPWNTALLVTTPQASDDDIELALSRVNQQLPDYARVAAWLKADEAFTVSNQQLTGTGRARRKQIWQRYAERIMATYQPASLKEMSS